MSENHEVMEFLKGFGYEFDEDTHKEETGKCFYISKYESGNFHRQEESMNAVLIAGLVHYLSEQLGIHFRALDMPISVMQAWIGEQNTLSVMVAWSHLKHLEVKPREVDDWKV